MELTMTQSVDLQQKQSLSQEQRLAMRLKQELKLEMSLKQVMKLVQKLWPQMSLQLGQKLEKNLTTMLRQDSYLRDALPRALREQPTAVELQKYFPQMAPLFNETYKSQPRYGARLRQGHVVAPKKTGSELTLSLQQTTRLTQQMSLRLEVKQTNWSLAQAYTAEEDSGCKLPESKLPGLDRLCLEERLRMVDQANELFHFEYAKSGRRYFKVPRVRNFNINPAEIAVKISKKEHDDSVRILEQAGRVQRIVRAVPYSEINQQIKAHLDEQDVDLEDVVLIGVDRGGRLPTHIVREALGKSEAYFLKVDQGSRNIDDERLQKLIDQRTLEGKYIVFVDSTVDSGRQISALSKYFDDEDIQRDIGHSGWIVVGSNDYGRNLDHHLNLDWGLDPDQTFEDNPQLMGVDYARNYTKVRACGNKMSSYLRQALLSVPKGIVLDTAVKKRKKIVSKGAQLSQRKSDKPQTLRLLLIGDGKDVTIGEQDARYMALKVEHGFHVLAGTPDGNPGYLLELVSQYSESPGTTLMQPAYRKGKTKRKSGHTVKYAGKTKDAFRDALMGEADVVLALPGNKGTWKEVQKALSCKKPTFLVGGGYAAEQAGSLSDSNLHICNTVQDAMVEVRNYRRAS